MTPECGVASATEATRARIGAAIRSDGDFRLLARLLAPDDTLTLTRLQDDDLDSLKLDLLIADALSFRRLREPIMQRREDAGLVVLPVLVLAPQNKGTTGRLPAELGSSIEDILRLPTTGPELRARISNLLHLRALSQRQYLAHDATRRELSGLSRALRTLHACNEIMLRKTTEEGLLGAICRMIAQSEGYSLAWVGFLEDETGSKTAGNIRKVAIAGPAAEFARSTRVDVGDPAQGQGPSGRAIATGETQIAADLALDASVEPWREEIRAWGLGAMIALPLKPSAGPPGVLSVFSAHSGDFEGEVRKLLERLAANLTFGLDKLQMQRERERQADEIRQLAYQDPLTGLPNRRFLLQQFHQDHTARIAQGGKPKAAAVLFIDINDFKLVNDALGHVAGDRMLRSVSQRIQGTLRKRDWVTRQGGDEFIAIMMDNPRRALAAEDTEQSVQRLAEAAETLATRIIRILRRPFDIEGFSHRIDASIGISLFPYYSADPESVISQADTAMYQAKQAGNGIAFYSPETAQRRQRRFTLEARLHHALEHEEFSLHYQPLWETTTGRVVGVEALLRWQDSQGASISPGEFIPVAEEIGLIGPIGDWVLRTAARQIAQWRRDGLALYMSVNLAVSQLQGPDAARHIADLAAAGGAAPEWWSLEVTEDMLMHDVQSVEHSMRELSALGFRFALDDFGRGYSSLGRLQSLPLHTLKIDKLFVDELASNERGNSIIAAITDMARNLSMETLAEGIETDAQRMRLVELGCRWGQGFWLSAARPPEEIPSLVEASLAGS
ncbi:bifunctional diguanylate cyclase/phosphodiesterase [Salinisphaera sp. LB1]|uniref:putative bifunctional diguanylate cyclase/phosphodiesterase n=1 Tax=Salinisphaera sp. LB1 TaxID=2183911 RepID=UPI000D707305|nr:EAL domain-containing protein [Salinisphaera sp. LB1]AWN17756.1 diguanylate cyclase/phosphodiesterase (GGDEF & EAL domains) with PAS/PAC sensor(s) [Salinisphaera sp. LB1]